jgi:Spy/CpxP family protein refolding chaperone
MQKMKPMRLSMAAALLAACCASTYAASQAETPPPDGAQSAGHGQQGRGPGNGFGHMPFAGRLRLREELSEAQRDKLFAIRHAAAPQRREQEKAIRHAHEALRALGEAGQFDEARAGAAARELGQAIAAEELLGARLHAQMLAVLTPEQREQLRQRRQRPPQDRP